MILKEMITRSKCCIIGIPDHQAVIHVGGRIGAGFGPAAFRKVLARFKGKIAMTEFIEDLGDVGPLTDQVEANHEMAIRLIHKGHSTYPFSVVIGGGHDHGYSHLAGISKGLAAKKKLGCINIDAHLDVRKPAPLITSGSPFFLAIESGIIQPKHLIEFGIQSHCNSPELWDYVSQKGIPVLPFQKMRQGKAIKAFQNSLKKLSQSCDAIVIQLDLDSLASAFAPGVSAPQAEGFTSMEIIEMMEIAGAQKKVISLGIFELNPAHDLGDQTSRVAATAAYHFMESKAKLHRS